MLISFSVLMNFDTGDLHNSLNISSGQAAMEALRCLLSSYNFSLRLPCQNKVVSIVASVRYNHREQVTEQII